MKLSMSSKEELSPRVNPLDRLSVILKDDLNSVNAIILKRMTSSVPLIPELAGHLIAAGGKRIRPLLTLASAALFGYQGKSQHKLAACVEFIHTATLLHDDVVDESDKRRGKSSANAIFGNEAAVLVGDFLFSRSFQLMVEEGSLDVLRVLSNASAVIAEGEVLQLSLVNDTAITDAQYYDVIKAKTAELFAAACEVGAIVANRSAAECQAMRDYGMYLGIAFQISDDVLDYAASEKKLGKSLGDDFKEGKLTLPVIKAIALADENEKAFWNKCLSLLDQQEGDFQKAVSILEKYNTLKDSIADAEKYALLGMQTLQALPDNELRECLSELIVFAAKRSY